MSSHNKKKNSGLLYEFLVRLISQSLVENNTKRSTNALKVLKKHFKPGTELYKEFRLINSLVRTSVSSEHVAANILTEAKSASRQYDLERLEKQKLSLLKDMSYLVKQSDNVFDQQINEYKIYATAQTLINEWRLQTKGKANLSQIASYEDVLLKWLMTPKEEVYEKSLNNESAGTNRLLMSVMMKKLQEKYSGKLTQEQASLIRSYALSSVKNDDEKIKKHLTEIKTSLLTNVNQYIQKESSKQNNEYFVGKLNEIKKTIENEVISENIDDSLVTKFLLYTKLISEINSEE